MYKKYKTKKPHEKRMLMLFILPEYSESFSFVISRLLLSVTKRVIEQRMYFRLTENNVTMNKRIEAGKAYPTVLGHHYMRFLDTQTA
ncbi:hypothetical protein HC62_13315 [Acetobacter tropicalis]|uniref:Uncharacterized protein n=1 Tax=Acetobacter tropicalis TaxID=104102 RepID=A0A252A4G0_9PROT|nr:hypothetical protein HC62_13315 [Acetobacter tropicalis]